MSLSKEVLRLRDTLHCNIVQEATVRNCLNEKESGVLNLIEPIELRDHIVDGVCCNTGLLLYGEDKIIPYRLLTLEDLAVIHRVIVEFKSYEVVIDKTPQYA